MKNIFDYATSELSQDAFLCWLFDNYNCEDKIVREISVALLEELTPNSGSGVVRNLAVFRQLHHTDVVVDFRRGDNRHVLVIEDKTFSSVQKHQTENYPKAIETEQKFSGAEFHYVVYKADCRIPAENEERLLSPWKPFYLEEIQSFFEKQPLSDCMILEQYREHIRQLAQKTGSVSAEPMTEWKNDRLRFRSYIVNELIPCAIPLLKKAGMKPFLWGKHYYPSLGIRNVMGNLEFSLEIIFRPESNRARTIVRLSEIDHKNGHIANEETRNRYWMELRKHDGMFQRKNGKWCIAVETKKIGKQLGYENNRTDVTQTCMELVAAFARVCERIKEQITEQEKNNAFE